jgi:hypothetical protein
MKFTGSVPKLTDNYTISFWIKPTTTVRDTIFGNYSTSSSKGINIERWPSGVLRIYYNGDITTNTTSGTVVMPKDVWTHVVIMYDYSEDVIRTYCNGVEKMSYACSASSYTQLD